MFLLHLTKTFRLHDSFMFGTRGVLEATSPAGKEQPELSGLTNTTAQPRGSTSGRELSRDRPTLEDTLSLVPGPHSYSAAHLHKWELEITSRRRTRTAEAFHLVMCHSLTHRAQTLNILQTMPTLISHCPQSN